MPVLCLCVVAIPVSEPNLFSSLFFAFPMSDTTVRRPTKRPWILGAVLRVPTDQPVQPQNVPLDGGGEHSLEALALQCEATQAQIDALRAQVDHHYTQFRVTAAALASLLRPAPDIHTQATALFQSAQAQAREAQSLLARASLLQAQVQKAQAKVLSAAEEAVHPRTCDQNEPTV